MSDENEGCECGYCDECKREAWYSRIDYETERIIERMHGVDE